MRILVTGASGKIGSRLVPRLLHQGHHVRILARDTAKVDNLQRLGAEVIPGDLEHPSSLPQALDATDAVVHLAAMFRGATPEKAKAVNHEGTLALADYARLAGTKKFIFASTSLVYGKGASRPASEDDPLTSDLPYPATKIAAEHALVASAMGTSLKVCILRLGFVYGENDPHIIEFLPRLTGWHPAKRLHMVHHADVAQSIDRAISTRSAVGAYNVADDAPISVAELRALHGHSEPGVHDGAFLDHPFETVMSTLKIRDELGYRPLYPTFLSAREAGVL